MVYLLENPTNMDDLGVPPFQEDPIWWKAQNNDFQGQTMEIPETSGDFASEKNVFS